MNGIRTITLDLDDTLWEIHPVIRRAEIRLYEWLSEHYPRITEMYTIEEMRILRNDIFERFPDKLHDLTFLRHTVLSEAATRAGYTEFRVDEAFAVFDEVRNDVDLFPETRPALVALAERYTLIAVTNGNANLEKIGIDHLFDHHVCAARAGAAKPHRQIFDVALSVGGSHASETLHVGDDPHTDIHGAWEAGLRTAWVNRNGAVWPEQLRKPDMTVSHIGELPDILL